MKTSSRASRKAGKKSPSAQSRNTRKNASAELPSASVYLTLIESDGAVINDAVIPPELHAQLSAAVASHRPPLVPLPAGTINIGPCNGCAERNATAFTFQMSEDVAAALDRAFGGGTVQIQESLRRAVWTALRLVENRGLHFPAPAVEDTVQSCDAILEFLSGKLIADAGEQANSLSSEYVPMTAHRLIGQLDMIHAARQTIAKLHADAAAFAEGWKQIRLLMGAPPA